MAYIYKDLEDKEHELYDSLVAEEMIDIASGEVLGYRVKGSYTDDKVSKETYEAIKKLRSR